MLLHLLPKTGELELGAVHNGTLEPFVRARLEKGRSNKTVNNAFSVVRHILNPAATSWHDEHTGKTYLESAPRITLLPLIGKQREPRPIT